MFKTVYGGIMPTRGTKYSAAVDLYANADVDIPRGQTKIVGLGIVIDNYAIKDLASEQFMHTRYIQLSIRSSLAVSGLILANGVGIIDMDYPDEIKMIITNNSGPDKYHIRKGDRIGQAILMTHDSAVFNYGSNAKRTGGLGSTGTR